MHRTLTITTPADDLQLLEIEEMRGLAGLDGGDDSQDEALEAVGLSVAAAIADECNIAVGSGGEPTLRRETCTEVRRRVTGQKLYLARRHDVEVASIVVDGSAVDEEDFLVDPETGGVTLLNSDMPVAWRGDKITVVYDAGFAEVPSALKQAASDAFRFFWYERSRDPSIKGQEIDIPDVERVRTDYWVGAIPGAGEGVIPETAAGQLKRFRNAAVA